MTFEEYLEGLREAFPNPPSYSEFAGMWDAWDANTKDFISRHISVYDSDPHLQTIARYLIKMNQHDSK